MPRWWQTVRFQVGDPNRHPPIPPRLERPLGHRSSRCVHPSHKSPARKVSGPQAVGLPTRGNPLRNRALLPAGKRTERGRSSGVEHNLAKVGVEGSNPFARSRVVQHSLPMWRGVAPEPSPQSRRSCPTAARRTMNAPSPRWAACCHAAAPTRCSMSPSRSVTPPEVETIRQRTLHVGARLERKAATLPTSAAPAEARSIALAIDGGHVKAVRSHQGRSFEVFVA